MTVRLKISRANREVYGVSKLETVLERLRTGKPPIVCSPDALRRFARRLNEEALLQDAEDASETMEKFAAKAKNEKVREGTLEAARQRLYSNALETNDLATLQKFFTMMA